MQTEKQGNREGTRTKTIYLNEITELNQTFLQNTYKARIIPEQDTRLFLAKIDRTVIDFFFVKGFF